MASRPTIGYSPHVVPLVLTSMPTPCLSLSTSLSFSFNYLFFCRSHFPRLLAKSIRKTFRRGLLPCSRWALESLRMLFGSKFVHIWLGV